MEWENIKELLTTNTSFCFMKMNDGELNCIINKSGLSRGAQDYNKHMDEVLSNALTYKDKNYFIGIPCNFCYKNLYEFCLHKIDKPYSANLLINENFKKTYDLFNEILPKREVILVCGDDANIERLPFTPTICFRVPANNSWEEFHRLKDYYKLCNPGSVVLFLCGPLGRGLAYEWYRNNKSITCIELGSFYDPWTRGKAYQYHLGNHRKCPGCCPQNSDPIPDDIINTCHHLERIYWNDYSNDYLKGIYGTENKTLKQVYYICYKTSSDPEFEYYCHWNFTKYAIDEIENEEQRRIKCREYLDYALKKWPERIEGIFEMAGKLSQEEKMKYLWRVAHIMTPESVKYSDRNLSVWRMLDSIVNDEYWLKHYRESYKAYKMLMERVDMIPESVRSHCIDNGRYAKIWIDEEEKAQQFHEDLANIEINVKGDTPIPKLFHFIYIAGNHPFAMAHYTAIKSCLVVQKAEEIHVWHGPEPEHLKKNKWWRRAKRIAKFHEVSIPAYINFNAVWWKQHQADYMRINILYKYGGVYMDLDVLSYRPLDGSEIAPQFENENITDINLFNQEIVMCRESDTKICNCVIMARKEHPFIKEWIHRYNTQYTQNWTLLSVETPAKIHRQHPEFNVCILKTQTFLPFMFQDFRFFYYDATNWLIPHSILIHLWDTESFKAKMVPIDDDYYKERPDNTYTKNFKQFTDSDDPLLDIIEDEVTLTSSQVLEPISEEVTQSTVTELGDDSVTELEVSESTFIEPVENLDLSFADLLKSTLEKLND